MKLLGPGLEQCQGRLEFAGNESYLLIKITRFDQAFSASSVHKLLQFIVFITALRQAALRD
jgi:hypothetical protein